MVPTRGTQFHDAARVYLTILRGVELEMSSLGTIGYGSMQRCGFTGYACTCFSLFCLYVLLCVVVWVESVCSSPLPPRIESPKDREVAKELSCAWRGRVTVDEPTNTKQQQRHKQVQSHAHTHMHAKVCHPLASCGVCVLFGVVPVCWGCAAHGRPTSRPQPQRNFKSTKTTKATNQHKSTKQTNKRTTATHTSKHILLHTR